MAIQDKSPNPYMAKTDIADAFRLVPLHPVDYHLTGFQWQNKLYYDRCLPQGSASSCHIFEAFSTALKWILQNKLLVGTVVKVLDDFLFIANTKQQCQAALNSFIYMCHELGVPVAHHKTAGPTQIITFLGIEIGTLNMVARLPMDKLDKYKHELKLAMTHDKLTLRELKLLIGKLQFATAVVRPGRAFLRRLYDMTNTQTTSLHTPD